MFKIVANRKPDVCLDILNLPEHTLYIQHLKKRKNGGNHMFFGFLRRLPAVTIQHKDYTVESKAPKGDRLSF